ncbi:uncharacterized protein IUM83_09081 [Phytophthora cinnamomi]|uniref:uncharacterized protein n=1 Tax=Phytophthora cinnamomi TaxID=4785 RepID=UPI002A312FBB|nr:hypothetical protein IUM83_09081 [Phytophthora cinnamomi]KAJ8527378.1 hypothetical protein ON010_g14885 [Phytophthora cinnamomi]
MKLLQHLLASAVCVAVLLATAVAEVPADGQRVSYAGPGNGDGHFGPFSGPEAEHNYDKSELYPGPDDSEDGSELATAADELEADDEQVAFEPRELTLDVYRDEFPDDLAAGDRDAVQSDRSIVEQELLGYTRHLRSMVDPPRPQEPLALPGPLEDDPEPPPIAPKLPEDTESKRNLRGLEQGDQL